MAVQEPRTNRWVATLAMAFLFTASWPMHAIAEQALPTSAAVYTNPVCANFKLLSSCQASTPQAACDLFYSSPWGGLQPNPVFTRMFLIGVNSYQCNYNYYIAAYPYGMIYHPDSALASAVLTISPTCPNATPPYTFNPGTGMCERPDQCLLPNVINPANGKCESPCPSPDVPDPATGQCVKCPVAKLTNPPFSDACSTSLEASKGFAPESTCGKLRDDMIKAAACITTKINALSTPRINYTGPSATIRTAEYQDHLRETWDKSAQLSTIMNSPVFTPATKQACVQRKLDIDAHKESHKLRERPSSAGDAAPHVEKRAIDISQAIVDSMATQVSTETTVENIVNGKKVTTTITSDVEDYLNSKTINPSPECNISPHIYWGGRFRPDDDPVHFQLK